MNDAAHDGIDPADRPVCDGEDHTDLAISARGVQHFFGTGESRAQVLFDVTLDIGRGEVVIMTGPSGSGKTTLLTLIGALRHVQQGSVRVLGRELAGISGGAQVEVRRQIGFIFQHHNLFSSLSALENVRMATALQPMEAGANGRRAAALLARLGLGDRLDYAPGRLSGGQRQRVAIARALANDPKLVLADEPTAALDAESGAKVMTMLHELAGGPCRSTVLIVTHDQRLIERADRIVNMVGGRIISNVRPALSIRIAKVLSRLKELAGLNESTLARIVDRTTVEYHRKGETIVHEGVPGDRAYVLASGVAEATKEDGSARDVALGERFGRITSISRELIPETVRAKTDLEVFTISKADFESILATDSGFEERLRLLYMNRQS